MLSVPTLCGLGFSLMPGEQRVSKLEPSFDEPPNAESGADCAGQDAHPPSLGLGAQSDPDGPSGAVAATLAEPSGAFEDPAGQRDGSFTELDCVSAVRSLALAWQDLTGKRLGPRGLAILVAHWALETGRGRRMVAHNFGGLKGARPGSSVQHWTREKVGDEYLHVRDSFRAYPTTDQGAKDYLTLLNRRYPRAFLAVRHGEVNDFVTALQRGGYFTDDIDIYGRAMKSLWFEYLSTGVAASAYDQPT